MKVTASTEAKLEIDPPSDTSASDLARWAARSVAQVLGGLTGVLLEDVSSTSVLLEDVSSTAVAAGGNRLLRQLAFMKILK